jgi:hypothetical protein
MSKLLNILVLIYIIDSPLFIFKSCRADHSYTVIEALRNFTRLYR